MRFLGSIFLFSLLAFCCCVDGYSPLSIQSVSSSSSSSSSWSSRSSVTPIYGTGAHHLSLKAHNRLEGQPKRIQRGHNGMHIETLDVVMTGCASLDFSTQVTIGSQTFDLIVDTGSTALGVASSTCSCSPANPLYSPSSTAALLTASGSTFSSTYGDGSKWHAAGYSDLVSMSGSVSASTIFGAIVDETSFFRSSTCPGSPNTQGIIGFAGPSLGLLAQDNNGNTIEAEQWFAKYQAKALVPDIFAIQMCLKSGDVWLGGYDNKTFSGELHWVNIQSFQAPDQNGNPVTIQAGDAYYNVQINSIGLTGFTADSTSSDYQGGNGVYSIVDSGTTLMLIPTAAYTNIVNALANYATQFNSFFGQSASTFFSSGHCFSTSASLQSINSALPTMEVILGGAANGAPLILTLNAASSYLMQSMGSDGTTFFCPGIANRGSSTRTILGWTFMNQLIVAHDLRNLKLGFGLRTGCTDGTFGAVSVTGGETGVLDAAIEGGSVTSRGAAGGGSSSGSGILDSLSGLSTTTIIIIVVAVVAGLIVLLALCWCCQSSSSSTAEQTAQVAFRRQQEQEFGKF